MRKNIAVKSKMPNAVQYMVFAIEKGMCFAHISLGYDQIFGRHFGIE